jgi:hypothetical protein
MEYRDVRLRTQVTAIAVICVLMLGGGVLVSHQGSGAAPVADAGRPSVILNSYAPGDQGDDAMPALMLADGAVFMVAALPGPCLAGPPCFDRAAVMAELVRIGGIDANCYRMTNLEMAGSYVTGRIDLQNVAPSSTGCA